VAGLSVFVYTQTASNLLATIDANLNSRADLLASSVKDDGPSQVNVRRELIGNVEVYAQMTTPMGGCCARRPCSGDRGCFLLRRPGRCAGQRWLRTSGLDRLAPAAQTVARRLCSIAGFYRYSVEEDLLDHSPAAHVRRPRLDYESHATGRDRNELGALPHRTVRN
jgi:hypothetical protein